MSHRIRSITRHRRPAGSAYIVTLLALVVLTIVGLSLALVSQTERELGANEIDAQRVFYSANSGIGVSTARALGTGNYTALTYIANRQNVAKSGLKAGTRPQQAADRVRISPFQEISHSPCNACELDTLYNVHYSLTSTAQRVSWDRPATPPADGTFDLPPPDALARSTQIVSQMVTVQPWESSVQDAIRNRATVLTPPGGPGYP